MQLEARGDAGRWWFAGGVLAIAALFGSLAVLAGRRLLLSGHMFPPDVLFGFDVNKALDVIASPAYFYDRNNVHPLFPELTRPFGRALTHLVTPGMAAILLNAAAGSLFLPLLAWYLRLRGVARRDAWLATLLAASGAGWLFQTALPSTPAFSMVVIALSHLLLVWCLRRPDPELTPARRWGREALWLITGVANYGLTVTNGFMSFVCYGFGQPGGRRWRGWGRAVVYGAVVLGVGLGVTLLVGSSFDVIHEGRWLGGGEVYRWPLLQSMSTHLFWTVAAPIPQQSVTQDTRHWTILTFIFWRYSAAGWVLLAGWGALLAAAIQAVWRDRDASSRKLNWAAAITLAVHILMHRNYVLAYEGSFLWAGHGYFMLMALLAPLLRGVRAWPAPRRRAARVALLILALGLAAHNLGYLLTLGSRVPLPPGYAPVR